MLYKYNGKQLLNIDTVVLILLLVPAIDVATGFLSLVLGLYSGYNMIQKMITLLPGIIVRAVLFVILAKQLIRYRYYAFNALMGLLSILFMTELVSLYHNSDAGGFFYGVLYIYKMIFILVVLSYILYVKNENVSKNLYLIVINTVAWYSMAIIIGHFIGMEYPTYGELGSSGFLIQGSANSASLAFLIASPFILSKIYYSRNNKEKILLWIFYFILIYASMLLLTKVSVLSLIIMFIIYYYYKAKDVNIVKHLFLFVFFIAIVVAAFYYLRDSNFIKRAIFVYEYMDGDILKMLMSGRDEYLAHGFTMYVNDYSTYQHLFGAGANEARELIANYTHVKQGIEIDFADIITKYGMVGFLLYYSIFIIILFKAVKCILFSKSVETKLFSFAYVLMFLVSNIAGHVFVSGLMGFLIPLLIIKIISKKKEDIKSFAKPTLAVG